MRSARLLIKQLVLHTIENCHNSHLAPFSLSGFQQRKVPVKPAPLSGTHSAHDNGGRSEITFLSVSWELDSVPESVVIPTIKEKAAGKNQNI
jgi:hypothetical protein